MPKATQSKPRDAAKTRARILAAAFDAFSEQGYAKTGTREIAAKAGVSSSLIGRYFESKANLFEETLVNAIYTHSAFIRDKAHFGEQMANIVASESNPKLTAMMVLAISAPESRAIAKRVSRRHVVDPLAEWIGPPDARARALSMLVLLNGFTLQMRHLTDGSIPPSAVKWLAGALQDIVDDA